MNAQRNVAKLLSLAALPLFAGCASSPPPRELVYARAAFHHSMNYRSVVAHGRAALVTDDTEKRTALDAIVDHVLAGRAADSRPGDARELAATSVLRLQLDAVATMVRNGRPGDDDEDLAAAVNRVRDGDAVFSPRLAGFVLDAFAGTVPEAEIDPELDQLTMREREVLRLLATDRTTASGIVFKWI